MGWKKIFGFRNKRENDSLSDESVNEMGISQDVLDIVKQVSNNSYQRLTIKKLGSSTLSVI